MMNLTLLNVIFFDTSLTDNRPIRKGFIFHLPAAILKFAGDAGYCRTKFYSLGG